MENEQLWKIDTDEGAWLQDSPHKCGTEEEEEEDWGKETSKSFNEDVNYASA
jgi:hypothetical protein